MKKNIKKLFFILLAKNIHSFNTFLLSEKFFFLNLEKNKYNVFLQLHCNNKADFDVNLGVMCFLGNKFIEFSVSAKKKDFFYFLGIKYKSCLFKIGFINRSLTLNFSYLYKYFESEFIIYSKNLDENLLNLNDKKIFNKKQNNVLPNDLIYDNFSLHSETDDFLYNKSDKGRASLNFNEKININEKKSNKKPWTFEQVSREITEKKKLTKTLEAIHEFKKEKNIFVDDNNTLLTSIFQLEMQIKKMPPGEIHKCVKKFHDLNNFMSSQYIKLSEYVLQEQEQKLNGLQFFLSSLRFKNFNKNNIKKNDESFIYKFVNNKGNKINSLQYKYFLNNDIIVEDYRKEHQNQKISLFLSVADKLKFEPYSFYENKHQFIFDLYAFEIFDIMKSTLKQNDETLGEIIYKNRNVDNILSIYNLQDLNFYEFYNKLSDLALKDKIAKLWLNEFNQSLNKTKAFTETSLMNFYKKVLDKCKIFLILKCLIDSQQGKKALVNFDLNEEIIDAILKFDLDCLTICFFQGNLYQKFKKEIDENKFLVNKKFFKNNFLKKKNLNSNEKLSPNLESELNLDFKMHLKSNEVKSLNENKSFFNKLQLYLATYNLLTQTKSNYIKESLQKKVNLEQLTKDKEETKTNVKQNNEVLADFLNGLKEKISPKFNRDLPINDFYETIFYRSKFIEKGLKNIHLGCLYEGFEIEDFLVNCLEKKGYFSDKNYYTYDLDFISSIFSFQKIYCYSLKKIENFRLKFMRHYNYKHLQKIKEIIKKTKNSLKTELENKKKLFKNHNITEYAYVQNLDHILSKINLIEKIIKNHNQYMNYNILINNIIIYPNSLNFVSDWSFLIEKNKKKELMNIQNMLTNINENFLKKSENYSINLNYSKRTFLYSLSVLNANFSSFESYTNSKVFFNQNLTFLFEEYEILLDSESNINLLYSMISNFKNSKMPLINCLKFLILNFTENKEQILQLIIISKICNIPVKSIQKIYDLMQKYKIKNLNDISKKAGFMQDEVIRIKENLVNDINLYIKNNHSYTFNEIKLHLNKIEKNLQSRAFFEVFIPLSHLLKNFKNKIEFDINLTEIFIKIINNHGKNEEWEKIVFYDKKINSFFKYVRSYIKINNIKRIF